ncbi:nSTAND1 domain-containing NTPase [Corallococcus carmarthensis]|uniref:nSTAND1 domain-containing NTPase n=1 Tax=Corallococcus carmarthensis TaxID=2316728 RepID=UPI00148E349D|nr:hypothetical protein [Corallococcus carmarthensis]NOK16278.1 hypothetical protein [Corallococcus carmarthensis]
MSLPDLEVLPARPAVPEPSVEAAFPRQELPAVPYRGIEPFRYEDRHLFFGRRKEIWKLVRAITIYRGFLLYGESGAGKSSLINAGLIPALKEEGYLPYRVRLQPQADGEFVFERIVVRSSGTPEYLPTLFPGTEGEERHVASLTELERLLKEEGRTQTPVLIFDQFEELITLFEAAPSSGGETSGALQQKICAFLVRMLRDHATSVKLLFAFREDYFAKLRVLLSDHPALVDHFFRLEPLQADSLASVIRGPFTDSRIPKGHFQEKISQSLAERLMQDLVARSPDGRPKLSEVQVACLQLWHASNPEEHFARRGIQGLLTDYLEQGLEGISAKRRDVAKAILAALVTPARTRNVVSQSSLVQGVSNAEKVPQDDVQQVLAQLETGTRVVQHELRRTERCYELVSEFLIDWILDEDAQRLAQRRWRKRFRLAVAIGSATSVTVIAVWWLVVGVEAVARAGVLLARAEMNQAQLEVLEAKARLQKSESEFMAREQVLEGEIKTQRALNTTQAEVIASTTKSRNNAWVENAKLTNEKSDLGAKLHDTQIGLETVKTEREILTTQLLETKKTLQETQEESARFKKERDDANSQLHTTRKALQEAQTEREQVNTDLVNVRNEKVACDSQLTEARQRLQSCKP